MITTTKIGENQVIIESKAKDRYNSAIDQKIIVKDITDNEFYILKQFLDDKILCHIGLSTSIMETVYNAVAVYHRGTRIMELDEIIDFVKDDWKYNLDHLDQEVHRLLWEAFGNGKIELEDDPLRQCVNHIIEVFEFMRIFSVIYDGPYDNDHLETTLVGLDLIGKVIFHLLYVPGITVLLLGEN